MIQAAVATANRTATAQQRSRAESSPAEQLLARFHEVRNFTARISESLAPEDCVVQSMPEVSWHLAHTTWFFETFILKKWVPGYRDAVPEYAYLFNSYYNAAGAMHRRDLRGLISRPTVDETKKYRASIDSDIEALKAQPSPGYGSASKIDPPKDGFVAGNIGQLKFVEFDEAIIEIGHDGSGFAYDNESPRHRALVLPFSLANRLVTNAEYLAFVADNGYSRSEFWLSLGWTTVNEQNWRAPLYWIERDGQWRNFTLSGLRQIDPNEPVTHLSYFEADAYANWAGARLPTEFEWERAAAKMDIDGNFVERERFHPAVLNKSPKDRELAQMFGDVWEWTRSAYSPYPGYRAGPGALGEYNGKFMCNQYVLRGGSCATSQTHIRKTYRNFFQPDKRWQFTGIRLAHDLS